MSQTAAARTPSPRVAQKQARARNSIIEAADELTRNRSVDDVSIKDITEAADVGQGTFYIHFKSKNEVLIPIMQADAARLDKAMQAALKDTDDPVVVLATSGRIMGRYVAEDPRWRWVLRNSSVPIDEMQRAFGQFRDRDYERGRATGDFVELDPSITASFTFGGFINVLVSSLDDNERATAIDQAILLCLRALGVDGEKAAKIVSRDLPSISLD
ncbi:MAG: TetR/AcrR family transcriptional regulator [Rhodobiaceae bacterium]|nr:TetR/AcrR family transcriptional regulator [Rhodobiaceae bacterium]